ncbi:tyrosinase family protein [Sphingorhabdus sp.]|uniref:tyrosinase family protein n=1 Tax=Sphingorhabdus sp. TaxID=1902408 RepID=UPI0035935A91
MAGDAQGKVNELLGATAAPTGRKALENLGFEATGTGRTQETGPRFSVFNTHHMDAAAAFADSLSAEAQMLKGQTSDDEIVMILADRVSAQDGALQRGIAEHGFKLFITHNPVGAVVRVPNLMSRMAPFKANMMQESTVELGGIAEPAEENRLNWFREDPIANEHHEHWHIVYPTRETADRPIQDRHGELFFYMHAQMLARYDAERMAAGLARVQPFADYTQPLVAGYDPGRLQIGTESYAPRLADQSWGPIPGGETPADHEAIRDKFDIAVVTLQLTGGSAPLPLSGHAGSDALGAANEPNSKGLNQHNQHYGNHHGGGHMFTAYLGATDEKPFGVMANTATAIRDPFFWQWHKHVDDINFRYQETQPSHDFAEAPPVIFGGGDDEGIVLMDEASLEANVPDNIPQDAYLQFALGNERFTLSAAKANIAFQADLGEGPVPLRLETTDVLSTEMRKGVFELFAPDLSGKQFTYPYLWHHPFRYAVRLLNQSAVTQTVTVRIFLCPAAVGGGAINDGWLNERRLWIELDKFEALLQPSEPTVASRRDKSSSVIRRPVFEPHHVTDVNYLPEQDDPEYNPFCECGWPYHLLIPRGTVEGMQFALLAVITGDDNLVPQGHCGSISFCGARDQYPDIKPMGYPFDRPLAKPIRELVADTPTMAMRFITIKTAPDP